MFTLAISFDHFQFALIHGPNIPGSCAVLFFTASDLASITNHIHSFVLFLIWLRLFILSGVISPLISSSILGTYPPGEFIFKCHIFLPFHTVHGVLKARIEVVCHPFLQWTTFCQTSPPWPVCLGWPHMAWLSRLWSMWSVTVVFILSALWWIRIRGLWLSQSPAESLEWLSLMGLMKFQLCKALSLTSCRAASHSLASGPSPPILAIQPTGPPPVLRIPP